MSAELRATYRLQLTPEFGFEFAAGLIPYLRDLGISHLYLSPSLQAREEQPIPIERRSCWIISVTAWSPSTG